MTATYHAATACARPPGTLLQVHALGHGASFGQRLSAALRALQHRRGHTRRHTPAGYARTLLARLDGEWCRIECPGAHGVLLDRAWGLQAWRRFTVHAAHYLPAVPAGHPCRRMHGHSFTIVVHAHTTAESLRRACLPLQRALDRQCLNELPGLRNPTSEQLARWIRERLPGSLHATGICVLETPDSGCHYRNGTHRIWKHLRFEAAVRSGAGRYGRGYRLCLHLTAPLDPAMGWTLDYGEIPARFAPVLEALDHRELDREAADPECLLRRIHAAAAPRLPLCQLDLRADPHAETVLVTQRGARPFPRPPT